MTAPLVAMVAKLQHSIVSMNLWRGGGPVLTCRCQLTLTSTESELCVVLTDPTTSVTIPLIRFVFPLMYSMLVVQTCSLTGESEHNHKSTSHKRPTSFSTLFTMACLSILLKLFHFQSTLVSRRSKQGYICAHILRINATKRKKEKVVRPFLC